MVSPSILQEFKKNKNQCERDRESNTLRQRETDRKTETPRQTDRQIAGRGRVVTGRTMHVHIHTSFGIHRRITLS